MKDINEILKEKSVKESRKLRYSVSLIDVVDEDGINVDAEIYIDKEYRKPFEKWLLEQEGNLFSHAEGDYIEY